MLFKWYFLCVSINYLWQVQSCRQRSFGSWLSFFLTLNIFSLPSTIIASAKKESQYGTKKSWSFSRLYLNWSTNTQLVNTTKFRKLPKWNTIIKFTLDLTVQTESTRFNYWWHVRAFTLDQINVLFQTAGDRLQLQRFVWLFRYSYWLPPEKVCVCNIWWSLSNEKREYWQYYQDGPQKLGGFHRRGKFWRRFWTNLRTPWIRLNDLAWYCIIIHSLA